MLMLLRRKYKAKVKDEEDLVHTVVEDSSILMDELASAEEVKEEAEADEVDSIPTAEEEEGCKLQEEGEEGLARMVVEEACEAEA